MQPNPLITLPRDLQQFQPETVPGRFEIHVEGEVNGRKVTLFRVCNTIAETERAARELFLMLRRDFARKEAGHGS